MSCLNDVATTNNFDSAHYYCALMTLRSSVPALQTMPPSTEFTNPPTTTQHQETPPLLQVVLETADLLRKFRQTYGFKSSPAFISKP